MRLDRFTIKAQEALQEAQRIAAENGQQEILPEHLLYALLQQPEGIVPPILQKLGANVGAVRADVKQAVDRLPKIGGVGGGDRFGQRLIGVIDAAWGE